MTKLTKFILAIALQVIIIFAIIIFKVSVLTGGTEILLKIAPVDPTSPLRGDYATFQYDDISNLDSSLLNGSHVRNGDTVYVVLYQSGKFWAAQSASLNKPTGNNQIFIKGKVASGGEKSQSDILPYQPSDSSLIHIVYGVEEYFIPEGKGSNFSFFSKEAAASVAIGDSGNAVLKRIYVDGKPWP